MSIQIQNLRKNYRQGEKKIEVLRGLNADIASGEVVAIVGPSGSGKSTLLSLLAGLDRPSEGDIVVAGQKMSALTETQMTRFRGQKIGIVFQQFHLVDHLTALENVMLPLEILGEDRREERATEILRKMKLEHRLGHFPTQLSGGECQRVAIARALVTKPDFILADEPSGSLDLATGDEVMNVFFDLVRELKTTTILVTHSEELAARCSRLLSLKDGQLAAGSQQGRTK